jgi:hypothetical protein
MSFNIRPESGIAICRLFPRCEVLSWPHLVSHNFIIFLKTAPEQACPGWLTIDLESAVLSEKVKMAHSNSQDGIQKMKAETDVRAHCGRYRGWFANSFQFLTADAWCCQSSHDSQFRSPFLEGKSMSSGVTGFEAINLSNGQCVRPISERPL